MSNIKVAVWGTLKDGHGNHFRLNNSKKISDDKLPNYRKEGLSLIKSKDSNVDVEVYDIDNKTYNQVDNFERMFGYVALETKLESGIDALVWFDNKSFSVILQEEYNNTWTELAEYDNIK